MIVKLINRVRRKEEAKPAAPPAPPRQEGDGPYSQLILRNVTVINGTGAPAFGPADIVIEGNRIAQVMSVGSPGGIIALSTPRAESEELALTTKLRGSFNPQQPGGSWQSTVYQGASQIIGKADFHVGGSVTYNGLAFDADGDRALGFNGPNGLTNAKEGIAVDWPIRYADIAPWYDYVERFAGISGQKEACRSCPTDSSCPPWK